MAKLFLWCLYLSLVMPVLMAPVFDPCLNYTVLDEPWRATNYTSDSSHCDSQVTWQGWYRLLYYGQTVQLPERCVPKGCGTAGGVWMRGTHPRPGDGVVTRKMCKAIGTGDCCYDTTPSIQVKACPGNFYVYEFVRPNGCNYAYCADMTTLSRNAVVGEKQAPKDISKIAIDEEKQAAKADPCIEQPCTEHEICAEVHGVYGCVCNKSHHQPNPESFGLVATCHNSSGRISLSRCQLFESGFSAGALHLNDPDCKGMVVNGRVEFSFNNDDKKCGTVLKANESHFIYENAIKGKVDSSEGHVISRQRLVDLQFACEYPARQAVSMDMAINALSSIVRLDLPVGLGSYHVQMTAYKDSSFTQVFSSGVAESLDKRIYMAVDVDGVDPRQLATVLDVCWATPVNDSTAAISWNLLTNRCPNAGDGTVKVLRNGESTSSRFSFRIFSFDGYPAQVYVHCSLHLCVQQENDCKPSCNPASQQRQQRSTDEFMVSCGPLHISSNNTDVVDTFGSVAKRHATSW